MKDSDTNRMIKKWVYRKYGIRFRSTEKALNYHHARMGHKTPLYLIQEGNRLLEIDNNVVNLTARSIRSR